MSKEVHFTYSNSLDSTTLKQGDILAKTPELNSLIKKIHPHYANEEYTHFQILTQSCDLVRRGSRNKCDSRYITLAAIRRFSTVIERLIDNNIDKNKQISIEAKKWCSDKFKDRIHHVTKSLFNNNDKSYFFLKAFPERGLENDSCTFLHLSIAIKSKNHYNLCLDAKIIELDTNFCSKLGWQVGNLYSRVGTKDYTEGAEISSEKFHGIIEEALDKNIVWINSEHFSFFKKIYSENLDSSNDELIKIAQTQYEKEKRQQIVTLVNQINSLINIYSDQAKRLTNFFSSSSGKKYLKG
ncbi:MAG: hypothetical protein ABW094_11655 [Candidatus Thiodiazotropha sp.]